MQVFYAFFKITIFFLLVIQIVEILKTYVIPILKAMIKKELLQIDGLKRQRLILRKNRDSVVKKIDDQKKDLDEFGESLGKWKKALEKDKKNSDAEKKKAISLFSEKKTIQLCRGESLKSELSCAGEIINLAAKRLEVENLGEKGERLLSKILVKM
jgi:hypothetical protein